MSPTALAIVFLLGGAETRPAASMPASDWRARVADLERREAADLRALIALAEAAKDQTSRRVGLARLVRLGAATDDERARLALVSLDLGALDDARTILEALRRDDPGDIRYPYLLAAVADRAKRAGERDDLLKAAQALRPADKAAHLAAGDFLAREGLAAYAETEWKRVLAVAAQAPAGEDVEAHVRLATLARAAEEFPAAVDHLRAALKLAAAEDLRLPESATDWLTVELALSLRDAGRTDEAKKHLALAQFFYRRRLERDPDDVDALNALAWFYAGVGERLDEGVTLVTRALAVRPGAPEFLDTLAELRYAQGRAAEAVTVIDRAVAALPRNADRKVLEYYQRQRAKFQRAAEKERVP